MINSRKWHATELAICLAVMMHLLLFIGVRPANSASLAKVFIPPQTDYLAPSSGSVPVSGHYARKIWSPILFSLPSEMGFSQGLFDHDVRTALKFSKPTQYESFLDIDAVPRGSGMQINSKALMISAYGVAPPHPSTGPVQRVKKDPIGHRIYMDSDLKKRLVGGIILPPSLNQEVHSTWQACAEISLTPQGLVKHVFLEQPLESEALNQEVIRMLHGLRFKPAEHSTEGRIEIYSPEAGVIK